MTAQHGGDAHPTAREWAARLAQGELSSVELTRRQLERIRRLDGQLNSFVTVTEEQALQQAAAADRRLKAGQGGPLTGVPFAHKDLFCAVGAPATCASRILGNFVAPYDATVTRRLLDAGMVMLGKTNMDEFAMGSSNETSAAGPARNPWDAERVPGGSSGGSAAAVAAGLAPCATGTDTGGSIRQPAALCGVTGLKPTYGRVSRYGMTAYASSLDQGGPLGLDVDDCAQLLSIMAGCDARDATSAQRPPPDPAADAPPGEFRIGLPREYFAPGADPGVLALVEEAARGYEKMGCKLREVSLPSLDYSIPAYYIIAAAECSSNLARYDGVRYGHRCAAPRDLDDLYCRSRAEGFGLEVKRRILMGTYVLSAGYYDAYYLKALRARRKIYDDFVNVFKETDALLCPVSPTPAFKLGEKQDDPVSMYLSDIYTVAVNLAGLPALALPAGLVDGLPCGFQLIAPHFEEGRLFALGRAWQRATDWHRAAPAVAAHGGAKSAAKHGAESTAAEHGAESSAARAQGA